MRTTERATGPHGWAACDRQREQHSTCAVLAMMDCPQLPTIARTVTRSQPASRSPSMSAAIRETLEHWTADSMPPARQARKVYKRYRYRCECDVSERERCR